MSDSQAKRAAGQAAAALVEPGMRLGLGTGSTVRFLLEALSERRAQDGLELACVPTSTATEALARRLGLPLTSLEEVGALDLAIDGADEIDPEKRMIKGGGGALLREKIIAAAAHELVVVVGANKLVDGLGHFPLPVEVLPFGRRPTAERIAALGGTPELRREPGGDPFVTDNGNHVLDCAFGEIREPARLEQDLLQIPGVLECGLFLGLAGRVLVGVADGSCRVIP